MKRSEKKILEEYDRFFNNTVILQLNRTTLEGATELRARHNIKTPDALHLACALDNQCDEFWTNDNRLSGLTKKIKIRILP